MDTMTFVRTALIASAVLVAGCGGEGAMLNEVDAGTGGAGGMAGTQTGTGGQAGNASAGTGGAPAAGGTIGSYFSRADHDMCMAWPVCPDDVFSFLTDAGRVFPQQCKTAFDGGRVNCAACMRKSTCEQFVGRCIARFISHTDGATGSGFFSEENQASCRVFLSAPTMVVPGGWALCTGDSASKTDDGIGVNANTVCKD
jgi:hypothetical protein